MNINKKQLPEIIVKLIFVYSNGWKKKKRVWDG